MTVDVTFVGRLSMASECEDEAKMGEVPLDFDESSMFRLISKTHVMLLREMFNTYRNFTRWDLRGTNSQSPAELRNQSGQILDRLQGMA